MKQTALEELYMMECLALARKGAGSVSPNPMVGCVIVRDGSVIGRGYHRTFGGPHAEVEAIRSAAGSLRGSTLYVNLEPCNHTGKTPPCTDLILRSKIARVVIGTADPNPLVSGRGIRRLRSRGIDVMTGVLREECLRLNEFFVKYITTRTPFVTLKVAQSLDGRITAPQRRDVWITGVESRTHVHTLRSQYDAVMVGAGTVRADNPRLTVRHVRGRNPVRVILDGMFRVDRGARLLHPSPGEPTILLVGQESLLRHPSKARLLRSRGVEVLGLAGRPGGIIPLGRVLRLLGARGISSLLVEGGASVFGAFLRESAADKLMVFIAPSIFGGGLEAFGGPFSSRRRPPRLRNISLIRIGEDALLQGYLH